MNPQHERLHERLEQSLGSTPPGAQAQRSQPFFVGEKDAEVEALVELARHLQTTPQLRPDADFAETLERRMLRHALLHQQQAPRGWSRRVLLIAACLGCVLLVAGTGVLLALTGQTTNPTHPPYGSKQWEQQTSESGSGNGRTPVTSPTADQVASDLQLARIRLNALTSLTGPTHTDDYLQALSRFDQQLTAVSAEINALPTGSHKTQMIAQLSDLRNDARQKLQGFLSSLTVTASIATTTELGRLGGQILHLSAATIVLPAHPEETATITITGSGIQSGAQLLVNGKLMQATSTLRNGQIVFVATWDSEQHPHTLGVLNPDGTAAQTSTITIQKASDGNNNGNGDNNGNGNGNGQ